MKLVRPISLLLFLASMLCACERESSEEPRTTPQEVAQEKAPAEKQKGKAPGIQIDTLELKIGKVVYKDYSGGGEPSVKEFNIGIDEKFQNIDDPNKVVSLIVVKALMNTTVAKLTNFDLQGLQGQIGDTLASAQKVIGKAGETLTKTTQQAQETVGALKKTVEGLKESIKLPFGSKK